MQDVERDLARYLDALTDRVAMDEPSSVPGGRPEPSAAMRRGWWLAAAIAVVIVVAVGAVSSWQTTDPDVPPVATDRSEPDSTPSEPDQPEPADVDPSPPPVVEPDEGWRELPDALTVRDIHSRLVWTGDLLVGMYPENGGTDVAVQVWDPTLQRVSVAAPRGLVWRAFPTIVWTGDEILMLGGSNGPGLDEFGVAFDPVADAWRTLTPPPDWLAGGGGAIGTRGAWTGAEVVFWDEQLAYDPVLDEWRAIAPAPLSARWSAAAVATDGKVWVWGGCPSGVTNDQCAARTNALSDGAVYDPDNNAWTLIEAGGPAPGAEVHAVWTGSEVIVVASHQSTEPGRVTVAAHDPVTNTWRDLEPPPGEFGPLVSLVGGPPGVVLLGGHGPAHLLAQGGEVWLPLGDPALRTLGVAAVWVDDTLVVTGDGRTVAYDVNALR